MIVTVKNYKDKKSTSGNKDDPARGTDVKLMLRAMNPFDPTWIVGQHTLRD